MLNNMAGGSISFPVKRKAEVGPLSNSSFHQQSLLPNKQPGQTEPDVKSLVFLQSQSPQGITVSAQSKFGLPSSPAQPSPNKKVTRTDSISGRSGLHRGQTTKKQTSTLKSSSKDRPESLEAVRSKMREFLADAFSLAFQNQDNVNTVKNQSDSAQAPESNFFMDHHVPVSGSKDVYPSKESASASLNTGNCQAFPNERTPDESSGIDGQSFQGFQYSSGLPDEDVPFGDEFFAKDDLLQGHGLSWAFDFDMQTRDRAEEQNGETPKSMAEEDPEHTDEAAMMAPENLAFKIESELFKLFGDVNKKYREGQVSLV